MKSKEKIIVVSDSLTPIHYFPIGTEVKLLNFDRGDCTCYCLGLDGNCKGMKQYVNVRALRRVKRCLTKK